MASLFEIVSRLEPSSVTLYSQHESQMMAEWRDAGVPVEIIEHQYSTESSMTWRGLWRWNSKLIGRLKKNKPDVVVCNDIRALMHSCAATKWLGIRTLFFIRDTFPEGRKYPLKWRLPCSGCDEILCLSAEMSEQIGRRLKPLWGRATISRHLYSIVDFDRMTTASRSQRESLRAGLGIATDEFAICYVAGICDKKNQLSLLRNAKDLLQRIPRAKIHLVGDFDLESDDYSQQCHQVLVEQGLSERVKFQGYSSEVSDWYRASDCTIVVSRREGLARCMIESLACGTPVVSFDVTSAREILERHECGRVVPQGDYQELFTELERLANDTDDLKLMGERGAEVARTLFSADANLASFMQIIERVAGE